MLLLTSGDLKLKQVKGNTCNYGYSIQQISIAKVKDTVENGWFTEWSCAPSKMLCHHFYPHRLYYNIHVHVYSHVVNFDGDFWGIPKQKGMTVIGGQNYIIQARDPSGILQFFFSASNTTTIWGHIHNDTHWCVQRSGFFLHRTKRGNLPPPPSNFLGYMYTIKQPMYMIFKVIPQH